MFILDEIKFTKNESLSILLTAKATSDGIFGDSLMTFNEVSFKELINALKVSLLFFDKFLNGSTVALKYGSV